MEKSNGTTYTKFSRILETLHKEDCDLTVYEAQRVIENMKLYIKNNTETKTEKIVLTCNEYKGSGKCWITKCDEHGKFTGFLDAHSFEKDGYKKTKTFFVPLIEGEYYIINEEGSKSQDNRIKKKVVDGKLVNV